jgi:phage/conjugal plasmid C-4 type zinc finger TraR family protein
MARGWAKDGAVQDQIDASVADAVKLALSQMARGVSLMECEDCATAIPEARRQAVPGVRRCIACQEEAEDSTQQQPGSIDPRGK